MFKSTENVEFAFVFGIVILGAFLIFVIAFFVIYKKRQQQFLLEKKLKESSLENRILKTELEKVTSIQKERERISEDLHDDIGSSLFAIRFELESLQEGIEAQVSKEKLDKVVVQSRQLTDTMRWIVFLAMQRIMPQAFSKTQVLL